MDPPVKFLLAGGQKGAARRAEPQLNRAAVDAAAGGASARVHGPSFSSGYRGKTTRRGKEKKKKRVTSSNSCYSKMELAVAEPIRARLRRLPLLRGLEPNAAALATSQDFQFTDVVHNNRNSLELFCHHSFIYTPKEREKAGWNLPDVSKLNSSFSIMPGSVQKSKYFPLAQVKMQRKRILHQKLQQHQCVSAAY